MKSSAGAISNTEEQCVARCNFVSGPGVSVKCGMPGSGPCFRAPASALPPAPPPASRSPPSQVSPPGPTIFQHLGKSMCGSRYLSMGCAFVSLYLKRVISRFPTPKRTTRPSPPPPRLPRPPADPRGRPGPRPIGARFGRLLGHRYSLSPAFP